MNFAQAIGSVLRNYVGFSGRAPRSEYWYWALGMTIGGIVAAILDYAIFETQNGPINGVFSLAILLPSIAVGIRRLHDIDRTGWWTLIVFTVIGAFVLIYWACVRGTPGPNRFGPDPLGGA